MTGCDPETLLALDKDAFYKVMLFHMCSLLMCQTVDLSTFIPQEHEYTCYNFQCEIQEKFWVEFFVDSLLAR